MNNFNIILKISEECPLSCSYCYYFRNKVASHRKRPKIIDVNVVICLCNRIQEYSRTHKIDNVHFSFHGGELLTVGKDYFCIICDTIKQWMNVHFHMCLQSNGVLLDDEWIDILKRYGITLGISLDGPKEYQNLYRKLKNGKGSFDIVDRNIRRCLTKNLKPGSLMVANPFYIPEKVFSYMIDDLGIKNMDILLRDYTYDTLPSEKYVNDLAKYMLKWMRLWFWKNDKSIKIRLFDSIINVLLGKTSVIESGFVNSANSIPTITVYTNGDVSPADEFISAGNKIMEIDKNIKSNSLVDIFSSNIFAVLKRASLMIPTDCGGCRWKYVCAGGGGLLERYSEENSFFNKSIYCNVWLVLFDEIYNRLIKNGYDIKKLSQVISGVNYNL